MGLKSIEGVFLSMGEAKVLAPPREGEGVQKPRLWDFLIGKALLGAKKRWVHHECLGTSGRGRWRYLCVKGCR